MALASHTIKPARGAKRKRIRVGRGNAAGRGTYAGRGLKGQKARSGVSNLKRLGMKQVLLRTPKKRGFKSLKPKSQVINVGKINKYFKDKETITPKILKQRGLISSLDRPVKILGKGELKVKSLNFSGVEFSANAEEQIKKLKGTINK